MLEDEGKEEHQNSKSRKKRKGSSKKLQMI
jgi:hypothetical protein